MNDIQNFDDLERQMQKDELEDASKLTPIEYGRLRGIKPQLIYYHLRTHNNPEEGKYIQLERCLCGKKVIDVKRADEYFEQGEFAHGKYSTNEE